MRFPYIIALVITLAGAGSFWYQSTAAICPAPLSYRVGQIDTQFNLTKEQAVQYLFEAESVWEKEIGRELFTYDGSAPFTVNFVFDDRQADANFEVTERALLDTKKTENETLLATVNTLQAQYDELSVTYKKRVESYEQRLSSYNEKVNSYNDQGGAPGEVFSNLEKEKEVLNQESSALSKTADELNVLADKTNELAEKGNQFVEIYNQEVALYNQKFGYSKEFTQGDYQANTINVYKFSDEYELKSVLTHEFGHALGIGHVEGESSIMYYLLKDTSSAPVLSPEDKEALISMCGTGDELAHRARLAIRSFLAIFK